LKTVFIILSGEGEVSAMYVCVCRVVTEGEVNAAIDAGADTVGAVTEACCAGSDCGSCHGAIEDMIEAKACTRRLPMARGRAA
jgi:bacterioferritin-associated ferredoxin